MTDERQAAPSTVTITEEMVERGTKALYLHMHQYPAAESSYDTLNKDIFEGWRTYARVVLGAALSAAARPPAPADSLEQAIAECEAKGWIGTVHWDPRLPYQPRYDAHIVAPPLKQGSFVVEGRGDTPLAALRSAMEKESLAAAEKES